MFTMRNIEKIGIAFGILIMLAVTASVVIGAIVELEGSDYKKDYTKATDTIDIRTKANELVARFRLVSNTYHCLVDCEAEIDITMYRDLDISKELSSEFEWNFRTAEKELNFNSYHFEILVNVTDEIVTPTYKEQQHTLPNGTSWSETVHTGDDITYETVERYVPFDFNSNYFSGSPSGTTHRIKIRGIKDKDQNVDWIPTFYGYDLKEWAWWNSSWTYKQQVWFNSTATSGSINVTRNLTIDTASLIAAGKMNGTCLDLRILNSTEDGELDWLWANYTNATIGCNQSESILWVRIPTFPPTNYSAYIYYGNIEASTFGNSSDSEAWDSRIKLALLFDSSATDRSGDGNDATLVNSPAFVDGVIGSAIECDGGAKQELTIPDSADWDGSSWTVTMWVKPTSFAEVAPWIVGTGLETSVGGWSIRNQANTGFQPMFEGGDCSHSIPTTLVGVWYHLAIVYSSSGTDSIWSFVNGDFNASATCSFTYDDPPAGWKICRSAAASFPLRYYNGTIDSLTYHKYNMSAFEVKQIYEYELSTRGAEETEPSDIEAPNVTLWSPANSTWNATNSQVFLCSATDNAKVENLSVYMNTTGTFQLNATDLSPVNDTNSSFPITVGDGIYIWNCYACDNSSLCNFSVNNWTLMIDTIPPLLNDYSRSPVTVYSDNDTSVGARATDTASGVSSCLLEHSSTNYTITYSSPSCNGTLLSGNYSARDNVSYYIWADDVAGNWNRSILQIYNITNRAPNASAPYLPVNNSNESGVVTLQWNLSVDPDGDSVNYWIKINDTTGVYNESGLTKVFPSLPISYYCWNVTSSDTYDNATVSDTFCFRKVFAAFDIYIRDEITTNLMNVSNFTSATLNVYCSNTSSTYDVITNPFSIVESCEFEELRLIVDQGLAEYFRTLIPTITSGNITFYMIDLYNDTRVYKTVIISDMTGLYTRGFFHVTKLIGASEVDIIDQEIDALSQVYLNLIVNERYTYTIETSEQTQSRVLGPVTADTVTSDTINLPEIFFVPDESYRYNGIFYGHIFENTTGLLRILYNDTLNATSWINMEVWNLTNTSNITRIYNNNQSGNNIAWSTNISFITTTEFFKYNFTGSHQDYGVIYGGGFVSYSFFGNLRLSFGGFSLTIYHLVAIFALSLFGMLFGYRQAELGAFIMAIMAAAFWYFGWYNVSFSAIVLIVFLAAISLIGRKEKEVGG